MEYVQYIRPHTCTYAGRSPLACLAKCSEVSLLLMVPSKLTVELQLLKLG